VSVLPSSEVSAPRVVALLSEVPPPIVVGSAVVLVVLVLLVLVDVASASSGDGSAQPSASRNSGPSLRATSEQRIVVVGVTRP
jgi:hypothetical protein